MTRPLLLVLLAYALAGCSSADRASPAELRIGPGGYAGVFDAAREAVTAFGFELDRVDARAGVITSRAKTTGGLLTPWDEEQSTARQEIEDLINDQQRRVRITFSRADQQALPDDADLRQQDGPMTARVEVAVDRIHHPGWRVEPTSVQQSRRWRDPGLQARGMAPAYEVPFTLDPRLAERIAERIVRRTAATLAAPADAIPRPVQPPATGPRPRDRSMYWE
jgi:hypothetical protein